jgi:hypothetical protein
MSKRGLLYIIFIVLFVLAVFLRQQVVIHNEKREITSVTALWKFEGKPVVVKKIIRDDIKSYTKVTVIKLSDKDYAAYVPKKIQEKIKVGQKIFKDDTGGNSMGVVSAVSQNIDVASGLFVVSMDFNNFNDTEYDVVYINTESFEDVICLPRDVIISENNEDFVWVVEDGKARKKNVTIESHNGYGSIIKEGLNEDDPVIFKGYTNIFDGDKLNIITDLSEDNK